MGYRLKREFAVPAKSGPSDVKASARVRSEGADGLAFKVLPHVDQEETYGAVYQRLNENGSIGIFPEGSY
jgi:glycerol-3-phosphate O-acyltransferase/dihydroxyacetone phosphate acyltransferase